MSGFSYPSGHSLSTSALYLTIAIIAGRYVQHSGARAAIFLAVSAVLRSRSRLGDDAEENLITLCAGCHRARHLHCQTA